MDLVKAVVEASRVIHIDGASCNCFRKLLACLTIIRRHFAVYFLPLRGGSRERYSENRVESFGIWEAESFRDVTQEAVRTLGTTRE